MKHAAAVSSTGQWTVWGQFFVQLQGIGATILSAAVMTYIICVVVEKTIGFRIDHEKEIEGLDQALHGEHGCDVMN